MSRLFPVATDRRMRSGGRAPFNGRIAWRRRGGLWLRLGVQLMHRSLHFALCDERPCIEALVDHRVDRLLMLRARTVQHIVDDFLLGERQLARMPDADPQS